MNRSAWFCPSCQKHHGPHVDTCPGPADAISVTPAPVIHPGANPVWYPQPDSTPWRPLFPTVTCDAVRYNPAHDPDKIVVVVN